VGIVVEKDSRPEEEAEAVVQPELPSMLGDVVPLMDIVDK
jgi:hypothetical protein